jgi:hypothetical protein
VAIRNVIFTIEVILAVLLASASVSCSNINVKLKLSRYAMKAVRRRGSTAVTYSCPRHYMRVSVQCHAPVAIYPWGKTTVPIGQEGLGAGLDTRARGNILCLCLGSNPVYIVCGQRIL